jgi:hypothetical protein
VVENGGALVHRGIIIRFPQQDRRLRIPAIRGQPGLPAAAARAWHASGV